ncbi:MAG: TetR/AcrR family transcriptional regulator [Solirubrobacterales bacterium]
MSPRPQIEHIRRPQILAAATEVIIERGVAQTRISDIAKRAGTSPAGVLYWFRSKDDLLTEALTSAEQRIAEELTAEFAELDSATERLLALIEGSVSGEEWRLWIELWARALHDPGVREARQRLDDEWRGLILRIIREGTDTGEFTPDSIDGAALALAGIIDGLAVQVTMRDWTVNPAHMFEVCIAAADRLLGSDLRGAAGQRRPLPTSGSVRR